EKAVYLDADPLGTRNPVVDSKNQILATYYNTDKTTKEPSKGATFCSEKREINVESFIPKFAT
ncbi:6257_t:CDS:2, partial [Gigaspora margarita]